MEQEIHVRLESLTGAAQPAVPASLSTGLGTFYIETFGCQMNDHDSEKVAGVLLRRGYRQAASPSDAHLVLYNTCSIREKAEQKVFSRLGLFNPKNNLLDGSNKIIGVLGCVAQQEGERIFERAPWVSLVCGSASYSKLPVLLAQIEAGNRRVTGLQTDTDETFETELTRRDNPLRAYVTIIEGCDKACTYCVVPRTRGPERSRTSSSILKEVRELADVGYTEVQLLGQTVNSYSDPSDRGLRFAELLTAVADTPGIRRVRFMTSHPRDLNADTVAAMDSVPQLCEHLHLPVQSGSTKVLRAMQRTYTREEYVAKIEMVRKARRPISITTDVIVGFPGETERDFEETLSLLDLVQFDGTFSFQYSPRPNTPAATMPGSIPENEKSRRLAVLQERQRAIQAARNKSLIGQTFEVLVEGDSRRDNQWSGRTSSNRTLNFTSPRSGLLGEYVLTKVTQAGPNSLSGEHLFE
jgi:tRNA-2-methylthio-N6-dimethylallyladenosine synthase